MSRPFIIAVAIADARLNDPAWAAATLAQAEDAGADMALLGSPLGVPFDPLVLAAWAAPLTRRIGLVAATPMPLSHPFHVARALSAIDFLSDGRAGWMPLPQAAPAGMAEDAIAAARSLWDGWGADTLIIDKASGRYLDSSKVQASHYSGRFFAVAGPVNAMRPPQGHPLLVSDARDGITCPDIDIAIGGLSDARRTLLPVHRHRGAVRCAGRGRSR